MKIRLVLFLVIQSLVCLNMSFSADLLLQSSDLTYKGAFRVPTGGSSPTTFSYGGLFLTFNSANNTLFISGIRTGSYWAEINIPTLVDDTAGGHRLSELNTATHHLSLPYFFDLTEGNSSNLGAGGTACSTNGVTSKGISIYDGKIIGTVAGYADSGSCVTLSHFKHGLDISSATGSFEGMYGVAPAETGFDARFTNGYMCPIPSAYQSALGGKILSGNANMSNASVYSYGPALVAFDPDDLGATAASAVALIGYPPAHRSFGEWSGGGNQYITVADSPGGYGILSVAFPDGTRSVLFSGRHGTNGADCYGCATTDKALIGQTCVIDTAQKYCYDLVNPNIGNHAYYNPTTEEEGYHNYIWAYDVGNSDGSNTTGNTPSNAMCIGSGQPFAECTGAGTGTVSGSTYNNLTAVKLGYTEPWNVAPYTTWSLPVHYGTAGNLAGMAFDPATRRLYAAISFADGNYPVIEVYEVSGTTPSGETGSLTVTLSPAEAVTAGAKWRLTGETAWRESGDTVTGLSPGNVTVEYKSSADME